MSIPVEITQTDYKRVKKMLLKEKEVICLDHTSYVATLLIGRELAIQGKLVAKIVKGF